MASWMPIWICTQTRTTTRTPPGLAAQGKAAILRFDEFTIETMQLLTQGDMAEYQANLDTVAPPAIPKLED